MYAKIYESFYSLFFLCVYVCACVYVCVGVLERKNLRLCIHKYIDVCARGICRCKCGSAGVRMCVIYIRVCKFRV